MHFGFALDSWNIDLWDIDLIDTDLYLFVSHGYIQISPVNILFSSKTSSRRLQDVFKTCLRDVFKRCLQYVFKTCLQDMYSRLFQHKNFWSSKTSSRCLQNLFARHLLKRKKKRWRRAEDVFKTPWRPTNVCWENSNKTVSII